MNFKTILRLGTTVEQTAVVPDDIDESTCLTDDEVGYLMTEFKRLQEEYFPDIPLASSLKHAKGFLYNIPRNVFRLIKKIENEQTNEILSPLFVIYPMLVEGMCRATQQMYLERLSYCIRDEEEEEGEDNGDE